MEQFPYGLIIGCTRICKCDGVHAAVSKDVVLRMSTRLPPFQVKITAKTHLIRQKGVDDIIRLLLSSIEHECNTHREATNDFLVLRLMRILQHLV